jgi:hypothetical protein
MNGDASSYRPITTLPPMETPVQEDSIEPLPYMEQPPAYQEPTYSPVESSAYEQPREEYLDFTRESVEENNVEKAEEQ